MHAPVGVLTDSFDTLESALNNHQGLLVEKPTGTQFLDCANLLSCTLAQQGVRTTRTIASRSHKDVLTD